MRYSNHTPSGKDLRAAPLKCFESTSKYKSKSLRFIYSAFSSIKKLRNRLLFFFHIPSNHKINKSSTNNVRLGSKWLQRTPNLVLTMHPRHHCATLASTMRLAPHRTTSLIPEKKDNATGSLTTCPGRAETTINQSINNYKWTKMNMIIAIVTIKAMIDFRLRI